MGTCLPPLKRWRGRQRGSGGQPGPILKMDYIVYVLESKKNGSRYVGFTEDLSSRLKEHHEGRNASTKKKGPWSLIHSERFATRSLAQKRERFFKTGHGREVLKNLLTR